MGTVYQINKGLNRPISFKGLKAQYIAYLSAGLVVLLLGFTVLYILGLPLVVLLPVTGVLGAGLFVGVNFLSKRFGRYGLMKYLASRRVPVYLWFNSRKLFTHLKIGSGYGKK
ncbi:DUF4133 domain-containing protein [Pedobacter sp. ISL-68]|uniref:DUF4133 domain-containing protein n=1 Tax=unclassified Pedobacter TaxID=2628915 RepID=UPI001BE719B7|nr:MULTISPECIES: DUF4133 domain-containing protein [unclassified Pedobacter]MBT2563769.1 DUF4133 domain-containing protein [Pedobacter sp. ISL-64]MBT2589661.1 DUF4133 domain-containing protein [Pedobacter sp. ISL-68]